MRIHRSSWIVFVCVLPFMYVRPAYSHWAMIDSDMPIKDVLPQVERRATEHPKDAHAQYLLGRVHSLAWATDGEQVRLVSVKNGVPEFAPYASVQRHRSTTRPATDAAIRHLDQAISQYRNAVELDPKNGLYHLGLGWMLEQKIGAVATLPATRPGDVAPDLKPVLDQYIKAFELRLEEDRTNNKILDVGDTFVSAEAAADAIRLLRIIQPTDDALIKRLEDGRRAVFAKGMAITPVVVALNEHGTLADLVDSRASVSFDLSGFDSGHHWPWTTRDAGMLVWDPTAAGHITSGRQLFGTMTWQMLFSDGYEALSTLDRDHNGKLSGDELHGIALWRDADGDAFSDAGEVVTADVAGITSIGVEASRDTDGVLYVAQGISWRDGRKTASFDWVPKSK